jgi:hypothetical protein
MWWLEGVVDGIVRLGRSAGASSSIRALVDAGNGDPPGVARTPPTARVDGDRVRPDRGERRAVLALPVVDEHRPRHGRQHVALEPTDDEVDPEEVGDLPGAGTTPGFIGRAPVVVCSR